MEGGGGRPVPRKVCQKQTENRSHSSIVFPITTWRGRQSEQSKQLTRAEGSLHLLRIVVFEAQHLFRRRIWLVLDLANICEGAASPCESGCLLGEHVSATAPGKNSWLSCTTFSPRRGLLAAGANEDMTTRSI